MLCKTILRHIMLTIIILSAGLLPVMAKEPLRIAYPEFQPFHYINADNNLTGLFYDILTESLHNRMNLELIWEQYPWARCQENVKHEKNDAILTVPTLERAKYTKTHNHPFYSKKLHIYTYVDHPQVSTIQSITSIDDIKQNNFSVITYSGNGWHKKHIESQGIKSYESSKLPNIWKMLSAKRGDIIIEWPSAAIPDIQKLQLQHRILDTRIVLTEMSFHLLIQKNSPHIKILQQFDEVIKTMQEDGTLQSIENKYK